MDGGLIVFLLLSQLPAQFLLCLFNTSDGEVTLLRLQGGPPSETMWGIASGVTTAQTSPVPGVMADGLTRALCSRTMACFFSFISSFSRIMDALPSDPSAGGLGPASSIRP